MTKVLVDGVEYIPSNTVLQIDEFRKVLESQGWISHSAIDEIINSLKNFENPDKEIVPDEKHCDPNHKSYINYDNILGFDDEGHILYNIGRYRVSKWTIHTLRDIQLAINGNSKPFKEVQVLSQRFGLSEDITRRLIRNLVDGNCDKLFRMWDEHKFNAKPTSAPVMVNNPEKRKEMGWF